MLATLTCTPVSTGSISAARASGIHTDRRVRWYWQRGLTLPESNPIPHLGKKSCPTGLAGAIGLLPFDVLPTRA
jgi:hypothetical protein